MATKAETPLNTYEKIKEQAVQHWQRFESASVPKIAIGTATCGIAAGALETKKAFEEFLTEEGIEAIVRTVGCSGHCYAEPTVVIHCPYTDFPPILYYNVTPGKARMLIRSFIKDGDPLFEYMLGAMAPDELLPSVSDFPRFSKETRVVMEKCGLINPESIYEYVALGGYEALAKALELEPEGIIHQVKRSGLRGRGGAGFPTGVKWEIAREAEGPNSTKYVICNADEGDPGAYMDRTILESNPHQVLEGMIICAYAIGASKCFIYVRAEYPLAVKTITKAIEEAAQLGFLGESVLGSSFDIQVEVFQGSGAFVCGEETALVSSIEGKRGMPRHRPPFPAEKGLWDKPTVINNVKTFASVPPILNHGARWFRNIGTESSPGTAIFSVVGDVKHAGLVEIPTGVTLRTLVFEICGGPPNKKGFKAVQIGGPSGGCLPEAFLDIPIDFDTLTQAGAMMGSGGMVVMDEETCMVDVARYFLEFTQKESCGKCTFCRIGTRHLLEVLMRITRGEGEKGDIELLEELARHVKLGSLCGLGRTAPNPVLTSLKYFRDEYEAHIKEKRCPAMVCRSLTAFYIDLGKCARGCDACVGSCPTKAIFTTRDRKKAIDQELCVKCGECVVACPPEYNAVRKISPAHKVPIVERPEEDMQD